MKPDTLAPPPKKLGGKEFEKLLLESAARRSTELTLGRYGTEMRWIRGVETAVDSMPDFEGVRTGGRQFIIEAKACSQASFPVGDKFRDRQYKHMKKRAPYGVPCSLIIHFNERKLTNTTVPAITVQLRVDPEMPLWQDFEKGLVKTINPALALANGAEIPWTIPPRCQKALPVFVA